MSKRKAIKTSIDDIVNYWFRRIDESDLSVDMADAHKRCWRWGYEKNLQRCHIIPHSRGGKDEPSNLVLLCKRCHAEGQNVTDSEIMWDWIKSYSVPFYDTFWTVLGNKEYEFIYNKSVADELKDLGITDHREIGKRFNKMINDLKKEASIHFGQPYFNNATVVGLYRMFIKQIAKELGKEISDNKPERAWWMK